MLRLKICRKLHRVRQARQANLVRFEQALGNLEPDLLQEAVEAVINQVGVGHLRDMLDHYATAHEQVAQT